MLRLGRGLGKRVGRAALAIVTGVFAYIAFMYLTLPDVRELRTRNPSTTAFMELRDREARAAGREPKRVHRWVPYSRISPHLRRAVLVAEDAGFWGHEGIDLVEIRKSLETDWERGSLMRGASTITQQLAKNLYLSPTRNPLRKLSELFITRRLEHELSKTRIFELYLNDIEWGDGIWGAEAAARTYFGIPASAVNPDQAALMAGAIVNPRVLNIARPNARLRNRQRIIRARMGYVTPPPVVAVPPPAEPGPVVTPDESSIAPEPDLTPEELHELMQESPPSGPEAPDAPGAPYAPSAPDAPSAPASAPP